MIEITDISDMIACEKCGTCLDFSKVAKKTGEQCDYQRSAVYTAKCPVCKNEWEIFK